MKTELTITEECTLRMQDSTAESRSLDATRILNTQTDNSRMLKGAVFGVPLLLLLLLSAIITAPSTLFAQGTAFTYQGRLDDGACQPMAFATSSSRCMRTDRWQSGRSFLGR
jgi:hypothetical protein